MYACMYYSAKLPVQRMGVYFLIYTHIYVCVCEYIHTHTYICKQNLTPSLNIFALLPSMSASKENTSIATQVKRLVKLNTARGNIDRLTICLAS